jgi:hypothetical protein
VSTLELTGFYGAIGYRQMRIRTLVVALALMGGALPAGCVQDVRFNPSGCDVHVRGRWLIDGQNPTAETCGNIALVELAIIDEPELEFWIPPEFSLRCQAESDPNAAVIDGGAYIDTMIVTRNRCGGSGEILDDPVEDRYKSRWRATTDLRFVVDCSPIDANPVQSVDGGTQLLLDVGTVNFQTADGGVDCPEP